MLINNYKPKDLSGVIGQQHLVGENGILTNMLKYKKLKSCIFYGPPGTGKTTVATIIANNVGYDFKYQNATSSTSKDITTIVETAKKDNKTIVLCLDEIQYFNKKQQQLLLQPIEEGHIILIGMTTDNPYFSCIDALLSRCTVLEFKAISTKDIENCLNNICTKISNKQSINITTDAIATIADNSAGDIRKAINILDNLLLQYPSKTITHKEVLSQLPTNCMGRCDTNGDIQYNLLSALQKSIRGSDPNAAIFYLARLLEGGDLLSPCRRLLVIANEDIGLANPKAIPFVYACVQMAKELGLPEANKPLTNAVLYLTLSPKCSTCEETYYKAVKDVKKGLGDTVPPHLSHTHAKGYKFPHDYPNHWCPQQYMPSDIINHWYYEPQNNEFEQNAVRYWSKIFSQNK